MSNSPEDLLALLAEVSTQMGDLVSVLEKQPASALLSEISTQLGDLVAIAESAAGKPPRPAAQINVQQPQITVNVPEQKQPQVTVNVPEQNHQVTPPQISVNVSPTPINLEVLQATGWEFDIKYDAGGARITKILAIRK